MNKSIKDSFIRYKEFIICLLAVVSMGTGEGGFLVLLVAYQEYQNMPLPVIGTVMAFLAVVEGLTTLIAGFRYRGKNEKKIVVFATLFLAASSITFYFQPVGILIWLGVALNAAGIGTITVILYTTALQRMPENTQITLGIGFYTAAIATGTSMGALIVGIVTDHFGFPAAFATSCVIQLSIIVWMFILKDQPPKFFPAKEATLVQQLKNLFDTKVSGSSKLPLGLMSAFIMSSAYTVFQTMFPIYGLRAGLSYTAIGSLIGLKDILAAVIRPVFGSFLKDWQAKGFTIGGLVIMIGAIASVPFTGVSVFLTIAVALVGLSFGSNRVTTMTLALSGQLKPEITSKRISLYNSMMTSGHIAGPWIGGLVAGWAGLSISMTATPLGLFGLFLFLLFFMQNKEKKKSTEEHVEPS